MTERKTTVNNRYGIHARPSAIVSKATLEFPGVEFEFDKGDGPVPIDDVIGVLAMGMEDKCVVTVRASGPDEDAACERIASVLATNFDFER